MNKMLKIFSLILAIFINGCYIDPSNFTPKEYNNTLGFKIMYGARDGRDGAVGLLPKKEIDLFMGQNENDLKKIDMTQFTALKYLYEFIQSKLENENKAKSLTEIGMNCNEQEICTYIYQNKYCEGLCLDDYKNLTFIILVKNYNSIFYYFIIN